MASTNLVEIELINSHRIPILNDWRRIYRLHEKQYTIISFAKKFPFISILHKTYTSFKFQRYASGPLDNDNTYKANCTLLQLAALFGVKIKSFEQGKIEGDLSK